jgi:hypothetical protein
MIGWQITVYDWELDRRVVAGSICRVNRRMSAYRDPKHNVFVQALRDDLVEVYPAGHVHPTRRTAREALDLARRMGWTDAEMVEVRPDAARSPRGRRRAG